MFSDTLNRSTMHAQVVRRSDLMDSTGTGVVQALLKGDQDYSSLGAVLTLDVAGWLVGITDKADLLASGYL